MFGCGGIVYAILLRSVPLNVAVSFAAAQLAGVILVESLVRGEPISPARWLGIACICLGKLLDRPDGPGVRAIALPPGSLRRQNALCTLQAIHYRPWQASDDHMLQAMGSGH